MFLWQYLSTLFLIANQIVKGQSCDEFTDLELGDAIIGTTVRVRLLLHTRANGTCGTLLSHTNPTDHPQFNLSRPTTFIIHGYRPSGSPPVWIDHFTAVLLARADMNVVVVDWNHGAATVLYFKAVQNTYKVADNVTAVIRQMKDNGALMSDIHLIGVSLGAHISGFVGANLNGKIGRITALDPAGPEFTGQPPEKRLDPTDAQFVDVLHTDIDFLGFREPLGHIDFYANGGADQPGCPKTILSGGSYFKCDHQRSVMLFIDTVNNTCGSIAFPCSSYEDFLDGRCSNCDQFADKGCPVFGYDVIRWKGLLKEQTKSYFKTNAQTPFCMTNYKVDVMIWNKSGRAGYLTIKLYDDNKEAVATIDHREVEFKKYKNTELFAQFDKDIQAVKKVSLKFSTGNVFQPKRKLRILKVRLTQLEGQRSPLCRYDVLLEENKEVTFSPIPCEDSNF